MITLLSKLDQPITLDCFFGPLTLQPGLNPEVSDRQWRNCKKFNPDAQALIKKGMIEEVNSTEG
ncbi:hypothetical protein L3556_02045 [Candidatus Synechococcus calcipolaris G9]|uniref:Uncharacterized protein n=1 Tax=Candidatus Synechococcus calcipolaris G9 TaxID=1497997 RepID=A0ABT6EWU9_9SYNE|nr:hypothetical protein [Candidatus Synechococcus calcipolaris]MDG2989721.1 hypothetical protein [Candidatus Synechococcus calcipolaris G9]